MENVLAKNNFQIDSLDKKILNILSKNAKTPFLEIARVCGVSGAAIHQRIQKLEESGIITGSHYHVGIKALGYHTCAYIGIQVNLSSTNTHEEVFERILQIKEIVECHNITGKYSLLLKVYAHSNEHLKNIIVDEIQSIKDITATETFISLEEGFTRQLPIE
ncbi:MAG: Lrp/AsnC ligand binding domain-containing protein [Bacteroidetes bacterium]|nr:Lrp/AsnC ligand binding domain-containing protein [Bacteroidota bacterium]